MPSLWRPGGGIRLCIVCQNHCHCSMSHSFGVRYVYSATTMKLGIRHLRHSWIYNSLKVKWIILLLYYSVWSPRGGKLCFFLFLHKHVQVNCEHIMVHCELHLHQHAHNLLNILNRVHNIVLILVNHGAR